MRDPILRHIMIFSFRVPQHLLLVANSHRSMTRLRSQRGSGAGNSTTFLQNKKKTQERRVYKSTADLEPPKEKTTQWAKALASLDSKMISLDSRMQSLESLDSTMISLDSRMQSLESSMKSMMESHDTKMLGLAASWSLSPQLVLL